MDSIDFRILRVGIEISGEIKIFESPFGITAKGSKFASATQNTCTVEIFNLSKADRNYLLTETSPFNKNRTPKKIWVEAGRVSTGTARMFTGEIVTSSPSQPPDIGLELKCQTGAFQKGNIVARSGMAKEKLSSLSKKVGQDIGTSTEFEASDKFIANYSYSGASLQQIDALAQAGNVDAFQDDETLVVKDRGKPRRNRVKIINANTGMIGSPEVTERGVKVQFLFDLDTALGGEIQLSSELNPALDGSYTIYKLDFELASRDTAWYYSAEASRNG
jgi:hypothetical protein